MSKRTTKPNSKPKTNRTSKNRSPSSAPAGGQIDLQSAARQLVASGFCQQTLGLPPDFGAKMRARRALAAEHAELSRKIAANLEAEWARIRGASGKSEPARPAAKEQDSSRAKR